MQGHDQLVTLVESEQDDILAAIPLVSGNEALEGHLFTRLVDLLVERAFLSLREQQLAGELLPDEFARASADLAADCRRAGLLPLPSRPSAR
jgi:hypothetical protein